MVVTRSNTNGWSIARAASISCGPEQTPNRKIAPIPRRCRAPAEEILSTQPFVQAEDSHPSAGRSPSPKRKRDDALSAETESEAPARKLPRVRLVVRPPRLFITIPRAQVLARISHNNRTITLLGRRRISCAWRPAVAPPPHAATVTRRSSASSPGKLRSHDSYVL